MNRLVLVLLAAAMIPACGGHKDTGLPPVAGTAFTSPMGYTVYFRGPVQNAVWDYFPSDPNYLDRPSALVAVDSAVEAFIASHTALSSDSVRSTMRGWKFVLYDDYVFWVHAYTADFGFVDWATGMTDFGNDIVSLAVWTRGTTQYTTGTSPAGIPPNTPPHTIRGPDY